FFSFFPFSFLSPSLPPSRRRKPPSSFLLPLLHRRVLLPWPTASLPCARPRASSSPPRTPSLPPRASSSLPAPPCSSTSRRRAHRRPRLLPLRLLLRRLSSRAPLFLCRRPPPRARLPVAAPPSPRSAPSACRSASRSPSRASASASSWPPARPLHRAPSTARARDRPLVRLPSPRPRARASLPPLLRPRLHLAPGAVCYSLPLAADAPSAAGACRWPSPARPTCAAQAVPSSLCFFFLYLLPDVWTLLGSAFVCLLLSYCCRCSLSCCRRSACASPCRCPRPYRAPRRPTNLRAGAMNDYDRDELNEYLF
ncbi:hypothetical protein BRADI_3g01126v3, partial [Brachypodium distachyon]